MNFKKMVTTLLLAGMALSVVGCGNSGSSSSSSTSTSSSNTSSSSSSSSSSSNTQTEAAMAEISLMCIDFEGSPISGEYADEVVAAMEAHTNTKVDFTFVANDSYKDKLSLTLASPKDMPMIISVSGMDGVITGAAEAGAFWDLSEFIYDSSKYPNLSQANVNVNQNLTINGDLIGIYKARPIGRNGIGYRADWAEKLGLDAPETIEDMYNMFYEFTYGDPDGNGKDDTYGLALCKYTGPFDIMATWFGVGNGWVEQDGGLVPVHMTPEYKEALDWFKKLYDDGLVYQDWAVRDTATWSDSVKNSECGVYIDVLDGSRRIWDYFENESIPSVSNPDEIASMALQGAINGKTLATAGYNGFFVITKAADTPEKVEACLNYLDKMCDDEMIILSSYGLEGVHWELDDNGFLIDLDAGDAVASKAYQALNQTVAYIPNEAATSPTVEYSPRKIIEDQVKADNVQNAVFNPALPFLVNSSTYSLSGSTLDQLLDDTRTQYIGGQLDEAGLEKQWDLWLKQGGQAVIDEVNEQYKANN